MSDVDPDTIYDSLTGLPLASQVFVDKIIGVMIVGWLVQLILAGFVVARLDVYIKTELYRNDSRRLRCLLYSVMFLLFLQSGISFYSVYHYATWQIRDADTLFGQTVIDCFAVTPVGLLGALVQGFLSVRASALFKAAWQRALYFVCVGGAITTGLLGSWMYLFLSFMLRAGKLDDALPLTFHTASGMWLWSCAVADTIITATLCFLLAQRFGKLGEGKSLLLSHLVKLAMETALITTTFAVLGAVLSDSFNPNSLNANIDGAFFQPIASLYSISLLVTLAAREKTRQVAHENFLQSVNTGLNSNDHQIYLPKPTRSSSGRGRCSESPIEMSATTKKEIKVQVDWTRSTSDV